MNVFDDVMSMTNVSLMDEEHSARILNTSPLPSSNSKGQKSDQLEAAIKSKDYAKLGSMALKHQESTLDGLKKENFDLRLSLYFYEQRLNDMSPDNIDKAIKENINLKVTIQRLTAELKKYKTMILDLNQAVEILQKKQCKKPHGMTPEEKEEFDKIKAEAEEYREENDKLSKIVAELSAENHKLRSTMRSRNASTSTTTTSTTSTPAMYNTERNNECQNEEHSDLYRKLRQAKLKEEEQQRIIKQLSTSSNRHHHNEDRETLIVNKQLENELQKRESQIHHLADELDEYSKTLHDTEQQLQEKTIQCEELLQENDELRLNDENTSELYERISELEDSNIRLTNELQNREHETATLEAEVEKLLSYLEEKGGENGVNVEDLKSQIVDLKEVINEKEDEIDALKDQIESITSEYESNVQVFEEELAKKDQENKELMTELEEWMDNSKNAEKELEEALEKQYNELSVTIRDREVRMATLEGDIEAQTDTMQREKKLLKEEMEELRDKLHTIYNQLKEKELHIADLTVLLNDKKESDKLQEAIQTEKLAEDNQLWQEKVKSLEAKLKEYYNKLNNQSHEYQELQHKLTRAIQRNDILTAFVEDMRRDIHDKNNNTPEDSDELASMSNLNDELKKELETEKKKNKDFETLYQEQVKENETLKKQLERRETMLTNSLLVRDTLKEQGQLMENILFEQATGGRTFLNTSNSSTN
ncbi:MAG: microtubule associated-domain-containing protein [Benjaminiella poitrasii]|nr:MAG: microtubule associated-domain-containing protein [Benjaminiella poitrasii]